MRRLARATSLLSILLFLLGLGGCTAIVDPGQIVAAGECPPGHTESNDRSLRLILNGMSPHLTHTLDMDVIQESTDGDRLVAQVILDPTPAPSIDLSLSRALREGPHRVDFYADINGDGAPSGCVSADADDHCWAEPICADGVMTFTHNFLFDRVDEAVVTRSGSDFTLDLTGLDPGLGEVSSTLRLFFLGANTEGQQVGLYRLGTPDASAGVATYGFQGIIDPGSEYRVELFFDVNNDDQQGPGDVLCTFTEVAEVTAGVWPLSKDFATICSDL